MPADRRWSADRARRRSRTSGSDYRVTFDQPPEPLDAFPQQLTIEDFVEPTS